MSGKICSHCKVEKFVEDFHKDKTTIDGLQQQCKQCKKEQREKTKVEKLCEDCSTLFLGYPRKTEVIRCRSCISKWVMETSNLKEVMDEALNVWKLTEDGALRLQEKHKRQSNRLKGEGNHNWKGGVSLQTNIDRSSIQSREWRKEVLKRDKYRCQLCGKGGSDLHAHHDKRWADFPNLRYNIDNGITLCKSCHLYKAHNGSWINNPIPWNTLKEMNTNV